MWIDPTLDNQISSTAVTLRLFEIKDEYQTLLMTMLAFKQGNIFTYTATLLIEINFKMNIFCSV